MYDMKKNIRRVFWLYFFMFLMIILYLGRFILTSRDTINSTYNPRLNMTDTKIKRGNIYDANGNIIAESILEKGVYKRNYPEGSLFAHTAGFIGDTKGGAEAKFNFNLQNLDFEVAQRIINLVNDTPLEGDSIYLTLDTDLQKLVKNALGETKGGVVVMEPKTGKVLSMVSYPDYNPNTIYENWDKLIGDNDNSPLINRTAQGLYPPGSIFKIITASAAMDSIPDINDFHYECKGSATFGESTIRCYDSIAHGTVDLAQALKVSCNTFFSQISTEMGPLILRQYAEKAEFNKRYSFELEHVSSKFSLDEQSGEGELIQTAIGQGKTLVTPLHMAMLISSVANEGKMMEPYICQSIESKWGREKQRTLPKIRTQVFEREKALELTEMLTAVVDSGTGKGARIEGLKIAGKTGTAEVSTGEAHGWFIAFAPAEDPKIAVAVVTENTGGTKKALSIAKSIFEYTLKNQ